MEDKEIEPNEFNDVDWYQLFGMNVNDVLSTINIDKNYLDKYEYSDSIYLKDKKNGYELCFNKNTTDELAHVTLYSEGVDSFHRYVKTIPYGVDFDKWNNTDIIRRFGDTNVKSGGSTNVFII